MVNFNELRTFLAFHFLLFFHRYNKVDPFYAFEYAFVFLSIGIENFYFFAYKAVVLLCHLEWLTKSGRAYFEFIVLFVAAEVVFDETAQFYAVFNPHTIGVIYFYYDTVVGAYLDVNKEILLAVKPLFYDTSYGVFVYHILHL